MSLFAYWYFFTDGLPIIWGPTASASEIAGGRELFEHEWTPNDPLAHGDGLGPVFNARSCAACHFQGGLGGGGGLEHNALSFEILPRPSDPHFRTGTIHNFSVDAANQESSDTLHTMYPVIPGRTITTNPPPGHCSYPSITSIPDFDPVRTQTVQPTALFGAGWVDLISDRAILRNARNRTVSTVAGELVARFDDIPVGRVRWVDGSVGKFGWKAQFARLEDFVAAACANELGLGTPTTEQARPLNSPNLTATPDLDRKQFRSLVSFVKTLPKPIEVVPDHADALQTANRGKAFFSQIGCVVCHVPDMGGVKGIYSDFLLYSLDDPQIQGGSSKYGPPPPQLQLPDRPEGDPKPSEWKTPALWGVADSAPYMHDGSAKTLHDAILRHHGDAKSVMEKYRALNPLDQQSVVAFLGTLKAPTESTVPVEPAVTRLARN